MSDKRKPAAAGAGSAAQSDAASPVPRCPWCSAELSSETGAPCPSCHAALTATGEPNVPGVTAIDVERIVLRRSGPPKKSRLMSWISGEVDDEGAPGPTATQGSVAPPSLEVRQEMIRLELEAHLAKLTAEAGALAAAESIDASARGDARAAADDIRAELAAARGATEVAAVAPATAEEPDSSAALATAADDPAPPAEQT